MEEKLIILLILLFLGLLMIVFGYLLKFKQKVTIISGINNPEEQILDKRRFTSIVGMGVLFVGIVLCFMGVLRYFLSGKEILIETIGLSIILLTGIVTYILAKKFIKNS
jgi:hypothetical protein